MQAEYAQLPTSTDRGPKRVVDPLGVSERFGCQVRGKTSDLATNVRAAIALIRSRLVKSGD